MIKVVEDFLKSYNIKNQNVLIGFSAGPDSCALALILNRLREKYNLDLTLCYFNHGWREHEAKDEEEFTKDFAKKINCDFVIEKAPKNLKKSEETAREARYKFFEKTAKKLNSKVVFLAHNKNDNVETLVYRIIKGTSTAGLTSIPEVRDIYYRPLLKIEKSEILDFLKKNKQNYKVDSSNNDEKYKRNLIRNKILPYFKEINPNYLNNIQNLISNAVATRKITDDYIGEIEKKLIQNNKISLDGYTKLDNALRLEILNNYFYDKLKYRTKANLQKLDDFILNNKNSKTSLNKDEFLVIKNKKIFIEKSLKLQNTAEIEITSEGVYDFENIKIEIKKVKTPKKFPADKQNCCYLNFEFPLTVRHRHAGDRFSPYGLKGTMKLKDYLINEKIEQNKKDELILLCHNNEIAWIAGVKISEKFKVCADECYKITLI